MNKYFYQLFSHRYASATEYVITHVHSGTLTNIHDHRECKVFVIIYAQE